VAGSYAPSALASRHGRAFYHFGRGMTLGLQ
jgi:hypothetical protein